jgi:hypothetical protein
MVEGHPIPGWCSGPGGRNRDRWAFLREEFACPYLAREAQEYPDGRFVIHAYPLPHLFYLDLIHVGAVLTETPRDLVLNSTSELAVNDSLDRERPLETVSRGRVTGSV